MSAAADATRELFPGLDAAAINAVAGRIDDCFAAMISLLHYEIGKQSPSPHDVFFAALTMALLNGAATAIATLNAPASQPPALAIVGFLQQRVADIRRES